MYEKSPLPLPQLSIYFYTTGLQTKKRNTKEIAQSRPALKFMALIIKYQVKGNKTISGKDKNSFNIQPS